VLNETKWNEITSITMQGAKLENIPDSLLTLKSLIYLNLNDNHITELPTDIKNLVNLEYLSLDNNQIQSIGKLTSVIT
jgi:Leucine-rich repeat (LRR) protein